MLVDFWPADAVAWLLPTCEEKASAPAPFGLFWEPVRPSVPLWRGANGLGVTELPLVRLGRDLNGSLKLIILQILQAFRQVMGIAQ